MLFFLFSLLQGVVVGINNIYKFYLIKDNMMGAKNGPRHSDEDQSL